MADSPSLYQRPSSSGSFASSPWSSRRGSSASTNSPVPPLPAVSPVLYQHPFAKIVKFELTKLQPISPTNTDTLPSITTSTATNLDYEIDAVDTLPWRAAGETIVALGRMKIQHVAGSTPFLHSGCVAKPLMSNSQCWCVDGRSMFVLRVGKLTYYRIELPGESSRDLERVDEFKQVLSKLILYEVTPCPFRRDFSVSLPPELITPKKKRPWKPKVPYHKSSKPRAVSLGGSSPDIYGPPLPALDRHTLRTSRSFADGDLQRPKTAAHNRRVSADFSSLHSTRFQLPEHSNLHEIESDDGSSPSPSPCTPLTPDIFLQPDYKNGPFKYDGHIPSFSHADDALDPLSPRSERPEQPPKAEISTDTTQEPPMKFADRGIPLMHEPRKHSLVARYTQNLMPDSAAADTAPDTRPSFRRMKSTPPKQTSSLGVLHDTLPKKARSQSLSPPPPPLRQAPEPQQRSTVGSFTASLFEKALRPPMQAVVLLLQIGIRIATAEVDPAQIEKYSSQIKSQHNDEDLDLGIPLPLRQSEDTPRTTTITETATNSVD
ncbi:hypothetical protein AAP_00746 [Ascosphaera apis ARSEF 7405]|uniref:Inheritance of peroxisomes protein 1 n=1 Tax=Ascosphaera apis ARSEF 7405 TaxID=392613 RepID=A0A162IRB0_9EURO|nr:hypothetical protein AAP_00746 [Ascosphaera apis ARSEF 7405]